KAKEGGRGRDSEGGENSVGVEKWGKGVGQREKKKEGWERKVGKETEVEKTKYLYGSGADEIPRLDIIIGV
ncbi:20416_t:CDS:2, partial [Dentiscutata erythropus]